MIESNFDKSINDLIKNLNNIVDGAETGIEELVKQGTQLAKDNCISNTSANGYDIGSHPNNITGEYDLSNETGVITTNGDDALYFHEMGTGVIGAGSSHPNIEAMNMTWEYDQNKHGEKGWIYHNEETGKTGWTKGLRSSHFMYDTYVQLKDKAQDIVNIEINKKL